MVSKSKSLIIIIPIHNEEKIIETTVIRVVNELNKISVPVSLLLIDDGSTDKSAEIVLNLRKRFSKKIEYIKHPKNKGYGQAIQTGIEYGLKRKIDYALFMDSDLTNNPQDIKKFVKVIDNGFDCVKASRYIKGGKVSRVPKKKVVLSRIGNFFASIIFNINVKDCTNGFLMLKLEGFRKITLKEKGFAVIMEELYYLKKQKARFKEIPVTLTSRGEGKSHFKYSFKTFYSYLKYPIKSSWL